MHSSAQWWLVRMRPSPEMNDPVQPLVEPHGRLAHAVEPGVVELDPVLLLDRGGGRVVEGPHAFVGGRGQGCERGERRERDELHRELQG